VDRTCKASTPPPSDCKAKGGDCKHDRDCCKGNCSKKGRCQ
jgi:hypothetical protein